MKQKTDKKDYKRLLQKLLEESLQESLARNDLFSVGVYELLIEDEKNKDKGAIKMSWFKTKKEQEAVKYLYFINSRCIQGTNSEGSTKFFRHRDFIEIDFKIDSMESLYEAQDLMLENFRNKDPLNPVIRIIIENFQLIK